MEAAAKNGGSNIEGRRPLRLNSKGWVVAGKNIDNVYRVKEFYPTGEWKKANEYLEIENELRMLLFSSLRSEQLNAYRAAIGPPQKDDL